MVSRAATLIEIYNRRNTLYSLYPCWLLNTCDDDTMKINQTFKLDEMKSTAFDNDNDSTVSDTSGMRKRQTHYRLFNH